MNKRASITAANILNKYEEKRLADLFFLFGELKKSRRLASAIIKARMERKIITIGDLLEIIKPVLGHEQEKKKLAQVFQALRMEVNHEMEALKELLVTASNVLNPHGRLSIITYHSLEDRMVKNLMKTGNVDGKIEDDFFGNRRLLFRPINNKVIIPSQTEIGQNPRSRSAKLRIAEKK
jgi:16S rRNA (cytosine1402-N4)-methyltransferase